jgi:hypothetical protein
MEIITYIVDGEFRHKDNLGNDDLLKNGGVHYSTIGTGLMHSVVNNSKTKPMRLLRIWILPAKYGLQPGNYQKQFSLKDRKNKWLAMVSNAGKDALPINQNAAIHVSSLDAKKKLLHEFEKGYGAYFYVIKGKITLNGKQLNEGDAAKIHKEKEIEAQAQKKSELIMIEVRI